MSGHRLSYTLTVAAAAAFALLATLTGPAAATGLSGLATGKTAMGQDAKVHKVHYRRYHRRSHRHRHFRKYGRHHRRQVVRAPFTRVETGRRVIVDAPFAHVYVGRGVHVRAPFVDLWVPRHRRYRGW
jgi:hypothetical protein